MKYWYLHDCDNYHNGITSHALTSKLICTMIFTRCNCVHHNANSLMNNNIFRNSPIVIGKQFM